MGKKERNYNPAEAARKAEKKRLKTRKKETSKLSAKNQHLSKENAKLERELASLVANSAASGADQKKLHALIMPALGKLNDVRVELGLASKTLADYQDMIRTAQKNAKKAKKVVVEERPVLSSSSDDDDDDEEEDLGFERDPNCDYQDLSSIEIPTGIAPETEGQIFKALTQLRTVKCKVHLSKKTAKPPQLQQPFFPVFPGMLPPFPIPFAPQIPKGYENYGYGPSASLGYENYGYGPNLTLPPPPPPIGRSQTNHPSNSTPKEQDEHRQGGRIYARQSHAVGQNKHDPLAPELDELPETSKAKSSNIVYSSAPQMRDLKPTMVPAALLKKKFG